MKPILPLLLSVGCGVAPLNPIDLSRSDMAGGGGDDMAMPSSGDMAQASGANCSTYTASSIANMRQGNSGCFELDGVVTLATTPVSSKGTSVTIYVQDAAGGTWSGLRLSCSSTSTSHPCSAFATAKNVLAGRSDNVTGHYIKSSAAKGGYEEFPIDSISDVGAGTAPAIAAGPAARRRPGG